MARLVGIKGTSKSVSDGVATAIAELERMGYHRRSVVGDLIRGKLIARCLKCDFKGFSSGVVAIFLPERRVERAWIYFICRFCAEEIERMDETNRCKTFTMLEEKISELSAERSEILGKV